MSATLPDALAEARRSLDVGDWRRAASSFRSALAGDESAEAHLGLATALWCGYEIDDALQHLKSAYRLFASTGAPARAAWVACWIAKEEEAIRGNVNVARGWFGRAARLLKGADAPREEGWYRLWHAAFEGDPHDLAEAAALAIEVARRSGDRDLEVLALAKRGQALLMTGETEAGMALLDESMAGLSAGEATSPVAIGECFCVLLTACEDARDYRRAEEWCRVALETAATRSIGFLAANCRASYGYILGVLGRCEEAETELRRALHMFETGHRHIGLDALAKLADLRRRQGRLEEAARLIREASGSPATLAVEAELALDNGRPGRALVLARQLVARARGAGVTEEASALQTLVRAAALAGQLEEAEAALAQLERASGAVATVPMTASLWLARGVLAQARASPEEGAAALWQAAQLFGEAGDVFGAGNARLQLAAALRAAGRTEEADGAAKQAREELDRLRRPRAARSMTKRELEVVRLLAAGLSNAAIAAKLGLSPHTVHRHVASILRRLDVPTRAAAAAEAARLGLV